MMYSGHTWMALLEGRHVCQGKTSINNRCLVFRIEYYMLTMNNKRTQILPCMVFIAPFLSFMGNEFSFFLVLILMTGRHVIGFSNSCQVLEKRLINDQINVLSSIVNALISLWYYLIPKTLQ